MAPTFVVVLLCRHLIPVILQICGREISFEWQDPSFSCNPPPRLGLKLSVVFLITVFMSIVYQLSPPCRHWGAFKCVRNSQCADLAKIKGPT